MIAEQERENWDKLHGSMQRLEESMDKLREAFASASEAFNDLVPDEAPGPCSHCLGLGQVNVGHLSSEGIIDGDRWLPCPICNGEKAE